MSESNVANNLVLSQLKIQKFIKQSKSLLNIPKRDKPSEIHILLNIKRFGFFSFNFILEIYHHILFISALFLSYFLHHVHFSVNL